MRAHESDRSLAEATAADLDPAAAQEAVRDGFVRSWAKLLFSFKGRATRFDIWARFFPFSLALWILLPIPASLALAEIVDGGRMLAAGLAYGAIGLLWAWTALAVGVKRCRDLGRSTWFMLLPVASHALMIVTMALAVRGLLDWQYDPSLAELLFLLFGAVQYPAVTIWTIAELGLQPGIRRKGGLKDFGRRLVAP